MKTLLLFLAIFCQTEDKTIYVVVDNSPQSQILQEELTRDWTVCKKINSECYALDNKRTELARNLIIVNKLSFADRAKHNIPTIENYPAWRVGLHKPFQQFPEGTFHTTSFPLLTTYALHNNALADEFSWKKDCSKIIIKTKSDYLSAIVAWAYEEKIAEANPIYSEGYFENEDEDDSTLLQIANKYKKHPTIPKYVPPILPRSPLLKFPFDKETK